MAVPPQDPVPPPAPWYRRYWGYYNRPYTGCGCLYTLLIVVLLWFILSLFIPPLAFWTVEPAIILLPFLF